MKGEQHESLGNEMKRFLAPRPNFHGNKLKFWASRTASKQAREANNKHESPFAIMPNWWMPQKCRAKFE